MTATASVDTCSYNQAEYTVLDAAQPVSVCFESMSVGAPNPAVDSSMLYALQYQFNCATDGMRELDVTLDIMFATTCP